MDSACDPCSISMLFPFSRSLGDARAKLAKVYSGCSPARLSLRGFIRIPILLRFDPLKALLPPQRRQLVHYPHADIRPPAAAGQLLAITDHHHPSVRLNPLDQIPTGVIDDLDSFIEQSFYR